MEKKLWTPGGDVSVGASKPPAGAPPQPPGASPASPPGASGREVPGPGASRPGGDAPTEEELRAELEMLAQVPVGSIVLQYASTLLTVAQLHLAPGELAEAQLALDVLSAVVDSAGDRLGAAAPQLREVLSQVQLMFVEATRLETEAAAAGGEGPGTEGTSDPAGAV